MAGTVLAGTVLDQLQVFWGQAYPDNFGAAFAALRGGIHPLDSGNPTAVAPLCIRSPDALTGNAYYCPGEDGIAYDTGVLVPVLLDHYGPAALISSLGHEFGHAVAARVGVAAGPTLVHEMQADCFAGNFVAWIVAGHSRVLTLSAADLLTAMAPLLDFADQPDLTPTDASAHGFAVDRAQSFMLGYRSAPTACRDMSIRSISVALGRFAVVDYRTARFTSDADVLSAARSSIAATDPGRVDADVPVADADRAIAAGLGQYALATAWVLAAAKAGRTPTEAACLAGRWTAAIYGQVPADRLGGRLTDVDEGLNVIRLRAGATAAEVFGYVDGFAGKC